MEPMETVPKLLVRCGYRSETIYSQHHASGLLKWLYPIGKKIPGIGPYLCIHNMLKAHAKAYHIYNNTFRQSQAGKIGIVLPCTTSYPKNANDTETPEINFQYECGWMAHPIFSEKGDYPAVMKERIAENSKLEGHPRSRLPQFTQEEIDYIRSAQIELSKTPGCW